MKVRHFIAIGLLLFFPATLWAQTVVFVHGFQSSGMDWRMRGVTPVLQQNGWVDGGNFVLTSQGPFNPLNYPTRPLREFFTVDLPARAPVLVQANALAAQLQAVFEQRQEPLILVGHSAGGVVARAWLVQFNNVPVSTLITIASPHLGTPLADMMKFSTGIPMSQLVTSMLGLGSGDSEALYQDLRTEEPGRFLYWLNHQPHPPIHYIAIVRDNQMRPDQMDFVVPPYSQNMQRVFALRGQTDTISVKGDHFLGVADGYALNMLLNRF